MSEERNIEHPSPDADRALLAEISQTSETLWERLRRVSDVEVEQGGEAGESEPAAWIRVHGGDVTAFLRRLSWDNIEPRHAAAALSPMRAKRSPAPWTVELQRYAERASAAGSGGPSFAGAGEESAPAPTAFHELWPPWTEVAVEALEEPSRSALESLSRGARSDLERLLAREIVRLSEASLFELFSGVREKATGSGSGLYERFIADCLANPIESIYRHYPVLARQTCLRVRQWRSMVSELLVRLERDSEELGRVFNAGQDVGELVAVESELSDRHGGGRQVLLLEFDSGLRVVYKPRSVGPEAFFASFLEWCRERGLDHTPPAASVLPRSGYGWMEFIAQSEMSREEARAYFRRAGALVALTFVLRARDLHGENLIATASGPVVVDCELVLQPERKLFTSGEKKDVPPSEPGSCLDTGLLTIIQPNGDEDAELAGLRGWTSRSKPGRIWQHLDTDQMTMVEGERTIESGRNCVWVNGNLIDAGSHTQEIVDGFEACYRFLSRSRDELLSPTGPLESYRAVKTRVLFRSTEEYGRVLYLLSFPRNQQSGLMGSWLHEAMLTVFADWQDRPAMWPLAREEREALEAGDVPSFWIRADETKLRATTGEDVSGLFRRSGLDAVAEQLKGLSDDDLAKQVTRIRRTLTRSAPSGPLAAVLEALRPGESEDFERSCGDLARALGDEIVLALEGGAIAASEWTLAEGPPGVALLLTALGQVDRDPSRRARWRESADAMLTGIGGESKRGWLGLDELPIGGLHGLGSLLWSLSWLARLRSDQSLVSVAEGVAALFTAERIATDDAYDVTFGAAGAIMGLLAYAEVAGCEKALAAARRCGDHLLARQEILSSSTAAWRNPGGIVQTGFAHGCAGIARSLTALAEVSGEPRFAVAAISALAAERGRFAAGRGNWPVLLADSDGRRRRQWMVAFCRGAPGVALSRMFLPGSMQDETVLAERELALDTCASAPRSPLDTLCCGTLGRSWILTSASQWTANAERLHQARALAIESLSRAKAAGRFRTSFDVLEDRDQEPAFLKGLSGIAYQLLRLGGAIGLPDVLALELESERRARCEDTEPPPDSTSSH